MAERVLVSGGAGFLGSHLVEELVKRSYYVTVLDNFTDAPLSNLDPVIEDIEVLCDDVRSPSVRDRVGSVNAIYHLAANANVPRSSRDPLFDASTNVLGTINMLELARECGARFLLASSGAVYGEPTNPPMAEDHPLKPVSPYGASKLAAEQYCWLYRRLYDVDATVFRFFNMYGPRQRRFVVYDFAKKILQPGDEAVILGDGRQVRSQLFVTDAVRALLIAAVDRSRDVYNIGSSMSLTVAEIMTTMLEVFGVEKRLVISGASWDGDIQRLVPDTSRLQALEFEEQVSFRDGLAAFRTWFDSIRDLDSVPST